MPKIPRLLITPGEPAGIGPDIVIQLAQTVLPVEVAAIADPDLLKERAAKLNLPLKLVPLDFNSSATPNKKGTLKIIPIQLQSKVTPGKLDKKNVPYVLQSLEIATDYCLQKKAHALVTGPVHKGIINETGIPFSGHTEFLAARCKAQEVLMLFVLNQLRVALATIHIPLAAVPKTITQELITKKLTLLNEELKKSFKISNPRIGVCGLNPHAGEEGHLGREEIDIILPSLEKLKKNGMQLHGPLPADTIFTEKYLQAFDAIFAMYHDQALPVIKSLGFYQAVNVTLGLPIIRTSVDHGTALDIAGTGQANSDSLKAAIEVAVSLI